jgi:hypothetical protein
VIYESVNIKKKRSLYFQKGGKMKDRKIILLLAAIFSIIILLATGCTSTQTPTTATTTTPTSKPGASTSTPTAPSSPTVVTKTVDPVYQCLSPRGVQPPVMTSALAPRLTTLDGKLIYVNQGEADPVIMPALWTRVQKDYPKVTWKLIASSSFGSSAPEDEVLGKAAGTKKADAVIRGIAW